jgi:hypothetical protein
MMDYLLEFPSVTSTVLCSACGKIPGLIRHLIFNPVLRRANPVKAQKSGRTSLLTVSEQSGCISGYFGKQKRPNPYRFRRFLMVELPLPNPNPNYPRDQRFLPLVRGSWCDFRPCSYMSELFYHHKGRLRLQTCL